jgi:hypothetical protein
MPLKLLVIHSTSLVGKSTIVASLLHPRLNAPRVFSVEKQNQDAARYGIEVVRYRVPDFKQLMEDILLETHDLIVDVGASQYADMMKEFARLRGAINDFDVVIVPTTPDGRVQEETLTTIEALRKVGLQMDKLRILFNRTTIDDDEDLAVQFEDLIAHLFSDRNIPYYKDLVLYENPIHADLRDAGLSFQQMERDGTDYARAVVQARQKDPSGSETLRLVRLLTIQRGVASAKAQLDKAFASLRLPTVDATAEE